MTKTLLAFLLLISLKTFSSGPPRSMSSLGDSISAGILAKYPLSKISSPKQQTKILPKLLRLLFPNGRDKLKDPQLSWSTGTDPRVFSHAKNLLKLNSKLIITNMATPSMGHEHIHTHQLPALKTWSKKYLGQAYPDYITLLIGANDICDEQKYSTAFVKKFEKSIRKSLTEILEKSAKSKVFILPIPQIDRLYHLVKDIPHAGKFGFNRCEDVWKKTNNCQTAMRPELLHISKRFVIEFNDVLDDLADELKNKYGDRVRFASAARGHLLPNSKTLAFDCFHPNIQGQSLLSRKSWGQTWWGEGQTYQTDAFYAQSK